MQTHEKLRQAIEMLQILIEMGGRRNREWFFMWEDRRKATERLLEEGFIEEVKDAELPFNYTKKGIAFLEKMEKELLANFGWV